MSILIAAVVIGLSMNPAKDAAPASTPAPEAMSEAGGEVAKPASYDRAMEFLAELDASDWEGSWNAAGPLFRAEASLAEWTELVAPAREPLGAVEDRELVTVQHLGPLQGTAARETHVLQFLTTFKARAAGTIETVFVTRGENGWEVTLYTVT